MKTFKDFFNSITEDNYAGGTDSAFSDGSVTIGQYGNQFPSTGDAAYAPGDYRIPTFLGARMVKRKRKKKGKVRRVLEIPMQRRNYV